MEISPIPRVGSWLVSRKKKQSKSNEQWHRKSSYQFQKNPRYGHGKVFQPFKYWEDLKVKHQVHPSENHCEISNFKRQLEKIKIAEYSVQAMADVKVDY